MYSHIYIYIYIYICISRYIYIFCIDTVPLHWNPWGTNPKSPAGLTGHVAVPRANGTRHLRNAGTDVGSAQLSRELWGASEGSCYIYICVYIIYLYTCRWTQDLYVLFDGPGLWQFAKELVQFQGLGFKVDG